MTGTTEPKTTPKAGRDLPAAIGVGLGIFVVLAAGLIWIPWLFVAVVALGLALAAVEIHRALLLKGMRAQIVPIVIGTALSVLGGYAAFQIDVLRVAAIAFVVICLAGMMLASLIGRLRGGADGFIRDTAASALIIAYIPMLGAFLPLLLASDDGRWRVLVVVMCVIGSDTGAYGFGVMTGRHKMAPTISPGKTWEGFAGGLFTAAVIGVLSCIFLLGQPWWVGVILGVLCGAAGTLGDLVESLIKRDAGIKDMSNFLPGHGGVMDRLDSMLVAVPVGWLVLYLTMGA